MLALVLVAALTACSGGSDRRADGPSAATASTSPDGAGDAEGDRGDRGDSEFCTRIGESLAQSFGLGAVNAASPEAMRDQFEQARLDLEEAIAVAPDDIRADLAVLAGAVNGLRDTLAAVNNEVAAVAPSAGAAFSTPEVQEATTRILAYVGGQCGSGGGDGNPAG